MIVWPMSSRLGWPHDRVAHVEPPASRGHGGDARVAMRAPGGPHGRVATSSRVTRCQGYPGCPRPTGRAPWWQRARGTVEHPLLASARSPERAGEPARGRAAIAARSARVPMSRVPMSLAPSARTSEHRRYSPDQGALGGLPAGDRAHTGRCGQKNGKAIGTLPRDASLPATRGLFKRRGAVTTESRRPGGPRRYQDGVRRRPAASKRPTWAEYRRQASAPTQFPGDRGLRPPHLYQPRRATTRRQPHPGSHAATRTRSPRIGNIGVQTANILRDRRDQVP
jgi:hypothetical protein